MMPRGPRGIVLLAAFWQFAVPAAAHDFEVSSAAVILGPEGAVQIDVSLDADALALGLPLDSPVEDVVTAVGEMTPEGIERALRETERLVALEADGERLELTAEFPHRGTPAAEPPLVLGGLARLRGRIPAGARALTFRADERLKTIELKFFDPARAAPAAYLVDPGEASPVYPVGGGAPIEQSVFVRYLTLGFEHILPKGLDHILFVLGLFLLSARWKPLLWQVTAFTLAHSVTLALAMSGAVSLPSQPVEVLIALSIAYVAIENLWTSELKPWRPFVVFAFGLLHGLGFAGVLEELGVPSGRLFESVLAFNLGVEAGQLAVIALAFAAVGWYRGSAKYRARVVVPGSLAIAAMGLYWAIERSLG